MKWILWKVLGIVSPTGKHLITPAGRLLCKIGLHRWRWIPGTKYESGFWTRQTRYCLRNPGHTEEREYLE